MGFHQFPHRDSDLAAAGILDCDWDETLNIETVANGVISPA